MEYFQTARMCFWPIDNRRGTLVRIVITSHIGKITTMDVDFLSSNHVNGRLLRRCVALDPPLGNQMGLNITPLQHQ